MDMVVDKDLAEGEDSPDVRPMEENVDLEQPRVMEENVAMEPDMVTAEDRDMDEARVDIGVITDLILFIQHQLHV